MDEVEEFYRQRGCPVAIDLCPLADITLLEILRKRGYRIVEFTNMLVHRVGEEPLAESPVQIREAGESDIDLWSSLLWQGFVGTEELTREARELGATLFQSEQTRTLIACIDDVPAGSAEFAMSGGLASFFCDSTLPAFRNRGVQTALIRYRLRRAAEAGCDMAFASVLPNSGSHANYFRAGFEVAYTRVKMIREFETGV